MAKLQCSKEVHHSAGSVFGYRKGCERKDVAIRSDGKPWCRLHSPEAVERRRAAEQAKWDAEMEADKKAAARAALCVAACEGVADAELKPGLLKELILVGIH